MPQTALYQADYYKFQVLVVAYGNLSRLAMIETLIDEGFAPSCCASFREAEEVAIISSYCGLLVDLSSIMKAKGEEKTIACSLSNFFPVLRVRIIGNTMTPIIFTGSMEQSNSFDDYRKICANFTPRRLRAHKRHRIHTPVLLHHKNLEYRSFTYDLSWGGAFLVCNNSDQFYVGDNIQLVLPAFGARLSATISRVQQWGNHPMVPGVGISWRLPIRSEAEVILGNILGTDRDRDRDRMVATN